MTAPASSTIQKTIPLSIFQRIADKDKTAVQDCLDTYGNLIWALARKFTDSTTEAAAAVQEIFTDIWLYAERGNKIQSAEKLLIMLIARRRLIKYLHKPNKIYGNIDTKNEQGAGTDGIFNDSEIPSVKNSPGEIIKTPEHFRVLYAEDKEDACLMVTVMLGFANIDVIAAGTVAEAWRFAQAEYFDLYLLDSCFPDGNGLDLCRHLREYAPHTPILFYSGNAYEADIKNGLAAGAGAYLTKPYLGDLAETISQAIKLSRKSVV